MKMQKKIAMSAGGAVLVACVTLGGLAAANAANAATPPPTPSSSPAATVETPVATAAAAPSADPSASPSSDAIASVPVPGASDGPYVFTDWIKTLSRAQQQAVLADLQKEQQKYEYLAQQGVGGAQQAVDKVTALEGFVTAALGQ